MSKSFIKNKLRTLLEQYLIENQQDINKLIDEDTEISGDVLNSFKLQNSLNKDIWDDKDTLNPKVKFKLLEIAKDFFKELELPKNVKLKDVIFTGSLANFNWSKFSDIDLHLVVDFDQFKEDKDFMTKHFKVEKTLWNDIHDIKIYNYPVEIYVQNIDDKLEATAIYSVLHNKWILKPSKQEFKVDKGLLKQKAKKFIDQYEDIKSDYANKKYKQVIIKVDTLWDKIKKMRQIGLEEGGEFSLENILFKVLRRMPVMDDLDKMRKDAYDKSMTLNESIKTPSPESIIQSVIYRLTIWYHEHEKMDACDINNGECMSFAENIYKELLEKYNIKTEILSDPLFWEPFDDVDKSLLADPQDYGSKPTYDYKKLGLPSHYWIYYNGKHYDSERIKGVTNFFDLPTFQEYKQKYSKNKINESLLVENNVWIDGGILLIKGKKLEDGTQRLYATHIKKIIELPRNRKDDTKGVAARMALLSDVFYVIKQIPDPNIEGNTILKGFKMDYKSDVSLSKVLKMKGQSASIVLNNAKTPLHWESLRFNSMGVMLNRLSNDIRQIPDIKLD